MSDLEQVPVRESLIRALQTEHAQFALIVLAGAVSGLAVWVEEHGGDVVSTTAKRADHLSRVNRAVSGVLHAAEDAEVSFPSQAEAFVDELMSLDTSGDVGVEWAAAKALAFVGVRCATCGYWDPDMAGRCPHCGRNPSHLLAMARDALSTAEPDDATLLRELEGDAGDMLRAQLPPSEHDDVVVISAALGSMNRAGFPGGSESRVPILLEGKTGSWRIASTRMS